MSYVNRKLEVLKFWKENPRIESNHATQEGIRNAIAEWNPKKLLSLCRAIIEQETLLEPPLIDTNNIVYDGNRRLTALSILNDPTLAPKSIQKQIKTLLNPKTKKVVSNIAKKIPCRQEKDDKLIQTLVDERHATEDEGLKQIPWGPVEKARRSDPNSLVLRVIRYGKEKGLTLPAEGYSTLERLITTGGVSSVFENELANKNSQLKKVIEKLYTEIRSKKLDTRTAGTAADRKEKMFTIFKEAGIECEKHSGTTKKGTDKSKSKSGTKGKSSPAGAKRSTDKRFLIDKNSSLPDVSQIYKINDIVHELRKLEVQEFPNAVGMLFRTLIELTTDRFLKSKGMSIDGKLREKLLRAINKIQQEDNFTGDGKDLESLKADINQRKDDVSITKLNAFVHANLLPNPITLCLQYNNMESLIAFMLSEAQRK